MPSLGFDAGVATQLMLPWLASLFCQRILAERLLWSHRAARDAMTTRAIAWAVVGVPFQMWRLWTLHTTLLRWQSGASLMTVAGGAAPMTVAGLLAAPRTVQVVNLGMAMLLTGVFNLALNLIQVQSAHSKCARQCEQSALATHGCACTHRQCARTTYTHTHTHTHAQVPWLVKKGNPVTPAGELYDQLVQTSDHIAATAHGLEYIPAGMRMTV